MFCMYLPNRKWKFILVQRNNSVKIVFGFHCQQGCTASGRANVFLLEYTPCPKELSLKQLKMSYLYNMPGDLQDASFALREATRGYMLLSANANKDGVFQLYSLLSSRLYTLTAIKFLEFSSIHVVYHVQNRQFSPVLTGPNNQAFSLLPRG